MSSVVKRFIFLGISFVFFILSVSANDITDDYYDIAQNYYKDGDKTKALEYVNQILEIDKNNMQALGFKIKLTPPEGSKSFPKFNKYIFVATQYLPTGNEKSDNYYNEALSGYKIKDYMLAEENLKKSIEAEPENFMAYNLLGIIYRLQNKTQEAITAFEQSNTINNSYTAPLDNLAQIYKQNGDMEQCYKKLKESQNLNENDFYVYVLLGDYYFDLKDYSEALNQYRDAIKINPEYYPAYYKIADTKIKQNDYSGANATLRYYLSFNPKDDYAYYLIARNCMIMGDFLKAQENIYKAIELCNCREYRAELGKINYHNDEIQDALDAFNSSISSNTTAEIYNYIGMCYYNLHEFNKAIANLNKSVSMPDSRVLYYYNLAQVYYTLKDNISYNKYMSLIKNYKPVTCQDYIDIGGILLDSDSKNAAISTINEGISKYPDSKELYIEKQKIYNLTNDNQGEEQAQYELKKVIKE